MKLRFAPSPTGLLHVGNARIALANFLFARRHGGQLLLRIDDTDSERSRAEYEVAIRQDLEWFGIAWDETFHQTSRLDRYAEMAERLKRAGRLYPCFESAEELRAKREMRLKRGKPPVYDRAMLSLTPEQREAAEAGGKRPYWRFRLTDGIRGWHDLVLGPRQVKLTAVSDPVLIRADGTPLYTFTSVVDDLDTAITHVVRGEDHVTNTAVQLDILAALGGDPDAIGFAHLPLLAGAEGAKLSKRIDSLSLHSLRADGIEAGAIAAYLASLGTADDAAPLPMEALAARFDFTRISHASAQFDPAQLMALNRRVLHGLDFAAVAARLPDGATAEFWEAVRGNLDLLNEARGWWDVVAGKIAVPVIEGEGDFLRAALAVLPPEPWDATIWSGFTTALREATGRKGRALFHPLRLALTGEEQGPELAPLLVLMGRDRAARRLAIAAG